MLRRHTVTYRSWCSKPNRKPSAALRFTKLTNQPFYKLCKALLCGALMKVLKRNLKARQPQTALITCYGTCMTRLNTETLPDVNAPDFKQAYEQAMGELRQQWVHPLPQEQNVLSSRNPCAPEETIMQVPVAARKAAEAAISSLWRGFKEAAPAAQRLVILRRLATLLQQHKLQLCAALTLECSKNFAEASFELAQSVDLCNHLASELAQLEEGQKSSAQALHSLGAGLALPGWDAPLLNTIATALAPWAAGNTVLLCPPAQGLFTISRFLPLAYRAGVAEDSLMLLFADAALQQALCEHARLRFVAYVGGLEPGLTFFEASQKVQLGQRFFKTFVGEFSHKNAAIVGASADLGPAADLIVQDAFAFQGQRRSALSRLIVVEEVYEALLDELVSRTEALSVGSAETNSDVSAVIDEASLHRVLNYLSFGDLEARKVTGGVRAAGSGYIVSPAIFADAPQSATIACEEIGGPVLSVMKAPTFAAALERANASMYGLAMSVFSEDKREIALAAEHLETGHFFANQAMSVNRQFFPLQAGRKLSSNLGASALLLPRFMALQCRY